MAFYIYKKDRYQIILQTNFFFLIFALILANEEINETFLIAYFNTFGCHVDINPNFSGQSLV